MAKRVQYFINLFNPIIKAEYLKLLTVSILFSFVLFAAQAIPEELTVVTEELPPYQYINEAGELDGFSVDVVKKLFNLTQEDHEIILMPWARAYNMAKNQKNVLIFTIAHTKERDKQFIWIGDLVDEKYYFWGLKSNFIQKISSVKQLKHLRITTLRNSNVHEYLLDKNFLNIHPVVNDAQRILMLNHNRVDLFAATELGMMATAKKQSLDFSLYRKVLILSELSSQFSIALNINSDEALVSKYQLAFKKLEGTGQLNILRKKWHIPEKLIK